jgi:undecaprenyl-diphosphatase
LDIFLKIDQVCFQFVNNILSNPLFDFIMPLFDETKYFIPLMLLPWLIAVIYDKKNRWQLAILIPLVIILVDQSGLFIKKSVLRSRPWAGLDPNLVNHLIGEKGRNYSFPSNHAANMAGLAMVFSSIYHRYGKLFWTIAGIVMFSRVYIGVHYPSDVFAGCILGIFYGLLLVKGWNKYEKRRQIIN